jgi:hypothetical protein
MARVRLDRLARGCFVAPGRRRRASDASERSDIASEPKTTQKKGRTGRVVRRGIVADGVLRLAAQGDSGFLAASFGILSTLTSCPAIPEAGEGEPHDLGTFCTLVFFNC